MTRSDSRVILPLALAAALAAAPAALAQEEPPLFDDKAAPQATPTPAPGAPEPAPAPAPPPRAMVPMKPLGAGLDFARWLSMTPRERQTFVEGAVAGMASVTSRLKGEVGGDSHATPDKMSALVKFIQENEPRRSPDAYLKEMHSIYMTVEGQKLSIVDCFLRAFQRLNGR
ncbi:MAG TPA: hypothetical protein VFT43_12470 [Candidatus Polarisedimenticolia bacterium]|nr:hypothetical protein [Candidatus Polarisedimenticolia bacterium]